VGKEIVARTIHQQSPRHKQPFVTVDCATLVENLFESELFGHVRGAFTGATETTNGKLELANGGTLFLDEIGNIGPEVQVKLLRVLQEREFMKVGGTQRIKVDVRVIAATNVDLLQAIREGTFREDLFYRISVIPISIPPLRERLQDIRLLVYHFFKKYGGRRNRQVKNFSDAALTALEKYHWPGNVRELENTIERALVMAEGSTIEVDDLFFYGAPEMSNTADTNNAGQLAKVEQREIAAALEQFGWQMAKTAEYLGINRKTLREKMKRYGLSVPIRE
jgi:DNA-binding NtrC family response regulator